MTDPLFLKGHVPTFSPLSWSPFSAWPVDCGIGEVRDIPTVSFPQSLARLMKCLSASMLHLTGMCTLDSSHSYYALSCPGEFHSLVLFRTHSTGTEEQEDRRPEIRDTTFVIAGV